MLSFILIVLHLEITQKAGTRKQIKLQLILSQCV